MESILTVPALIADLKPQSGVPLLIGGDLNEIFYHSEKVGGPSKPQAVINDFKDSIVDYQLYDLGYSAYGFTWCNFHENEIVDEECLDYTEMSLIFPEAIVSHIDYDLFGHLPILLKCRSNVARQPHKRGRFHSKNMWLSEPSCLELVSLARSSCLATDVVDGLLAKVDKCAIELMKWNKKSFEHVRIEIRKLEEYGTIRCHK
ncbi:hypothetical protein Cgig2_025568 [Carnegiea gigantea]|uniref:Endonuclease/exonuclease/phosphatase domain-containing protein n=1 Tax=Carnegiea gigantea TaxID=171969 RepID=A0A9Q1JY69_9CARY|nr:hypothetical protein Cgig2_025568 [Carnegiea gigantea]